MTGSDPYAVPLSALERVRVAPEDQVAEQAVDLPAAHVPPWGGALPGSLGTSAGGGGADGDGE